MSLDVYIEDWEPSEQKCICECCGCQHTNERKVEHFHANITHNLAKMASLAGLYHCCWKPEEIGIQFAADLIPYLRIGLQKLHDFKEELEKLNPSNGWGNYEGLVSFTRKYLDACIEFPTKRIVVCA